MLVVLQEDKRMNSQLRTWAWKLLPTNIVGLFFGMLTPVPWAAPFAAGLAAAWNGVLAPLLKPKEEA